MPTIGTGTMRCRGGRQSVDHRGWMWGAGRSIDAVSPCRTQSRAAGTV